MILFQSFGDFIYVHFGRSGDADALFNLFFVLSIILLFYENKIKNNICLYFSGLMFSLAFLSKSFHAIVIFLIIFLRNIKYKTKYAQAKYILYKIKPFSFTPQPTIIKTNIEVNASRPVPAWLEKDAKNSSGKVLRLASREDVDIPVEEHLIVELYSK